MIWQHERFAPRPLLMPHYPSSCCVESEPHEWGYQERDECRAYMPVSPTSLIRSSVDFAVARTSAFESVRHLLTAPKAGPA